MIVKAINHAVVIYQIHGEEDTANDALLVHIDNGDTLCIEQEDRTICINNNPANLKQILKAIQQVAVAGNAENAKKQQRHRKEQELNSRERFR